MSASITLLYTMNKKKNVFLGSSFFYHLRKNSPRTKMSIEPLPQPVAPGGFRFHSCLAAPGKYRFTITPGLRTTGVISMDKSGDCAYNHRSMVLLYTMLKNKFIFQVRHYLALTARFDILQIIIDRGKTSTLVFHISLQESGRTASLPYGGAQRNTHKLIINLE